MDQPDHVRRNRALWDQQAADWVAGGRRGWATSEMTWGIWQLPEAQVGAVPSVDGRDVVELGCGTAYWSAWLARRGARVVALDNSARQLTTARMLQREHGLAFPLVHADAEQTPFRTERFDLAISEYGASIWCDPYKWIPEAARLLRPNGELVFLRNSTLAMLCTPDTGKVQERLLRPQLGMNRMDWPDTKETEFQLGHGDLIRLLVTSGFEILDMVEIFASADAVSHPFYGEYMSVEWAQKWPSEEMWRARKR